MGFFNWLKDRALRLPSSKNSIDEILGIDKATLVKGLVRVALADVITKAIRDVASGATSAGVTFEAAVVKAITQKVTPISPVLAGEISKAVSEIFKNIDSSIQSQVEAATNKVIEAISKALGL